MEKNIKKIQKNEKRYGGIKQEVYKKINIIKKKIYETEEHLNPKVLEWLEENIKDKKDLDEKTPLERRKRLGNWNTF